jgi:hypothetical protein
MMRSILASIDASFLSVSACFDAKASKRALKSVRLESEALGVSLDFSEVFLAAIDFFEVLAAFGALTVILSKNLAGTLSSSKNFDTSHVSDWCLTMLCIELQHDGSKDLAKPKGFRRRSAM